MRVARKSTSEISTVTQSVGIDPRLNRSTNADSEPDNSQTRWQRIARRAYELAQQRGLAPGAELSDWLQAEQEIDAAERRKQAAGESQITG